MRGLLMLKSSYYEGGKRFTLDVSFFHLGVSRPGRRSWGQGDGFSLDTRHFPLAASERGFEVPISQYETQYVSRVRPGCESFFPLAGLPEGLVTGLQAYRKRRHYRKI